jgi:hypothetical protein
MNRLPPILVDVDVDWFVYWISLAHPSFCSIFVLTIVLCRQIVLYLLAELVHNWYVHAHKIALGLVMEEEVIQAGVSMFYTGVKQMLITIRYYFILTEF